MARLVSIRVTGKDGLKGRSFEESLAGIDLFAGPNGAGKSTRLLAVLAGLRNLADTPSDPLREYLGPNRPHATIDLVFDDGKRITRCLADSNKTAASKSASGVADALVGPALVRWDLADFATASDADRSKLIERVCSTAGAAQGWNRDRVAAELRPLLKLGAGDAWPDIVQTALSDRMWESRPTDVGTWLPRAITFAREEYTKANAAKTAATKHADGAQAEQAVSEPPPGSIDVAKRAVAELEQDLARARAALETARGSVKSAEQNRADGDRLARELAAAQAGHEQWTAALAERKRAVDDLPPIAEIEGALTGASHATTLARLAHRTASEAAAGACAAHATATAKRATLERLRGDLGPASACRHCGGDDPLAIDAQLAEARAEVEDAQADLTLATRKVTRADADVAACEKAEQAARTRYVSEQSKRGVAAGALREAETAVTSQASAIATAEANLQAWQERQAGIVVANAVDLPGLEAEIAALQERLAPAKAQIEAHIRHQERERALQKTIAAREEATARLAEVKRFGESLKALQEQIAREAFGPIEEGANALLTSCGLELRVKFLSAGDFGATLRGTYVAFWALSDSERAIVAVGVAVAIARLSRAPWRAVVLDGLERIDEDHLPGVLAGLGLLVEEGQLDNVLGALVRADRAAVPAVPRVQVHWLGAAEAARESA
jgi:hypothetical protein